MYQNISSKHQTFFDRNTIFIFFCFFLTIAALLQCSYRPIPQSEAIFSIRFFFFGKIVLSIPFFRKTALYIQKIIYLVHRCTLLCAICRLLLSYGIQTFSRIAINVTRLKKKKITKHNEIENCIQKRYFCRNDFCI